MVVVFVIFVRLCIWNKNYEIFKVGCFKRFGVVLGKVGKECGGYRVIKNLLFEEFVGNSLLEILIFEFLEG